MILSDVLTTILFLIPLAAFCVAAIYVGARGKAAGKPRVRRKAPEAPPAPAPAPELVPIGEGEPAPHTHPAADPGDGEVLRERVPSPAGSLGEIRDEGCAEHGDVRYVLKDAPEAPEEITELERHVVWSEILGKPLSLRGRGRR